MSNHLVSGSNKGSPNLRFAVGEIISRISASLPDMNEPVKMYLAGGMAVNFYTGYRPTMDVDASFSKRLLLPRAEDLMVPCVDANGELRVVYFDMNYNTSFALMHPDFEADSLKVDGDEFSNSKLELHVLSPVDLALSKVGRFENNDKEDIAELARHNLISSEALRARADDAIGYYIGNPGMLFTNLQEAISIIDSVHPDSGVTYGH